MKCDLCGSVEGTVLIKRGITYYEIRRCDACGLVLADPLPSLEAINSFYGSEYTYFTPAYARYYARKDYKKAGSVIHEIERFCKHGNLLDVGCAAGFLLAVARDRGWKPEGVEITEDAGNIARQNGFHVHKGSIETISLRKNFYDAVTLMDSLEHMQSPSEALKRIHSFMRMNGILVIETPNFESFYKRLIGKRWAGFNKFHIYFFTPTTISMLLEKSGFKILKLVTRNADLLSMDAFFRWGIKDAVRNIIKTDDNPLIKKSNKSNVIKNVFVEPVERLINFPFAHLLNLFKLGDQIRVYAKKII